MTLLKFIVRTVMIPVEAFRKMSRRQRIVNGSALVIGLIALFGVNLTLSSTNQVVVEDLVISAGVEKAMTANDLRPEACRTSIPEVEVTALISGGEPITGTNANELIISDENTTAIDAGDGDDCIIGGPNANHIAGGNGYDVCIVLPAVVDVDCELRVDQV
jgi:Ca2+-binding RTX toxin-like protein